MVPANGTRGREHENQHTTRFHREDKYYWQGLKALMPYCLDAIYSNRSCQPTLQSGEVVHSLQPPLIYSKTYMEVGLFRGRLVKADFANAADLGFAHVSSLDSVSPVRNGITLVSLHTKIRMKTENYEGDTHAD
jgi:hypothetical protein